MTVGQRLIDQKTRPAGAPEPTVAGDDTAVLSQWQLIRLRFARHHLAMVSVCMLVILYLMAAFAEFVAPYPAAWRDTEMIYAPPQLPKLSLSRGLYVSQLTRHVDPVTLKNEFTRTGETVPLGFFVRGERYKLMGLIPWDRHLFGAKHPEKGHVYHMFGADRFGRDVYSRLVFGARISLSIGIVSIFLTFFLGVLIGGISGYLGGSVDNLIQRAIEVINAFPQLPLWLAFAAVMPGDWSPIKTYFAIGIVLSLLGWTGLARVVRGKILSLREEDYATAARLIGCSHGRIIFRHLLPGFTSHIIVSLSLSVPAMILGETALSFLGLGLRPPVVSWGVMLQDCMDMNIVANYPWLLIPVIFIVLTVLAFNFVGDGMRDAADPYSHK